MNSMLTDRIMVPLSHDIMNPHPKSRMGLFPKAPGLAGRRPHTIASTYLQHWLIKAAHTMRATCLMLILPFSLLLCHHGQRLALSATSTYMIAFINSTSPKRST